MKLAERVNLDFGDLDRDLVFLKQLGVSEIGIMVKEWDPKFGATPAWWESPASGLRRTPYFHVEDLRALKSWIEGHGFNLYSIMGLNFTKSARLRPDEPGYGEAIENVKKSIRNMGEVGIPQYAGGSRGFAGPAVPSPFKLNHWRTSVVYGRGGAQMVRYTDAVAQQAEPLETGPVDEAEIWDDTRAWMDEVLPVAENAGVTLVHHPADPPVPALRGIAKILKSAEDFDKLFSLYPSPANKMVFCLGCFSQRYAPDGVVAAIKRFGDRIAEVHFRNVQGDMCEFTECYPDEGKLDMIKVMETLKNVGYDGPVVIDHTPHGIDDTVYGHRGRAFGFGYLRGILQAIGASN